MRSGRVRREHDFLHPSCYRSAELVHRLDNAETVARIIRECDGVWLPLNHALLGGAGATHCERGNVMADESPTPLHAFSSGPWGPLSRRCQLSSFDARQFTPHGQDGNTSGHPVSWSPVRPVHTTRPMAQTTMWLAVHLLTAYNFGGLDRDERRLLEQGWHSAGQAVQRVGGLLDGVTPKMLTQTLRALERDGLVHRTVYPTVPPSVEYGLTTGIDAGRLICAIADWSEDHAAEILAARSEFDHRLTAQPTPVR